MKGEPCCINRKSNKIRDIVRLQQILKKWNKIANSKNTTDSGSGNGSGRNMKFLKKTLSFSESTMAGVRKGHVAVCVGKEAKRFLIPTVYLRHQMFEILLQEAEEEFGFQQQGVLQLPCEVDVFQKVLKMIEEEDDDESSGTGLMFRSSSCSSLDPQTQMLCR